MFAARIRILGLSFFVALTLVWARVAYLQLALEPWYRATLAESETRTRLIPAPRGTIRAADGSVLAQDRCDADLAVHYRYLERPLDDAWLAKQALARLSRRERRDPERVERTKDELRAEIESTWRQLAELTATDTATLDTRARLVQRRVERIAESVNRRRRERLEAAADDRTGDAGTTNSTGSDADSEDRRAAADSVAASAAPWRRFLSWLADAPPRPPADPQPVTIVEQTHYHTIVPNVPFEVLLEFTTHAERYPGVRVIERIRREYPEGDLACSVIGYVEPLPDAASDDRPNELKSGIGRAGIEGFYQRQIAGEPGEIREQLAARGGAARPIGGRPPRPGHEITLTLDVSMQRFAEALLERAVECGIESAGADTRAATTNARATSGAIVVMDVVTGAVLVAATAPRFDLNAAAQPATDAGQDLAARPDSPLFNRVAQMSLPPGSTFKPVVALAALEAGVNPNESYLCRGYLRDPDHYRCLIFRHFGVGHENVNMTDAIVRSCNVYFFQLAGRVGLDEIVRCGELLGFGCRTGIDLASEDAGQLPRRSAAGDRASRAGSERETLSAAIGQGGVTATPIQVAVMMAAISNGGQRVVPHLRRDAFQPPLPIERISSPSDRSLAVLRRALERVVSDPRGTGHEHVFLPEVEIAGKTGTAQSGSPRGDHAWFAGYVPAKSPRYAIVCVLEHAGSGGHAAGPLARDLVRRMHELGYFVPREVIANDVAEAASSPP